MKCLVEIITANNAPSIGEKIKEKIRNIENPDDYILSVQLDYRDNHTLFYLHNIKSINFNNDFLEINQKNNGQVLLDYNCILEYCIINAEELYGSEII